MDDRETLVFIADTYGTMILRATTVWGGRPEIIAGIMMRETRGGLSSLLDKEGPEGRGDGGHGHGLMQIDDRSFPHFCAGEEWKDPQENIKFGAYVLHMKYTFFSLKKIYLPGFDLELLSIAAYNAGEGRVYNAVRNGDAPDAVTTHYDYSQTVLYYSHIYLGVLNVA